MILGQSLVEIQVHLCKVCKHWKGIVAYCMSTGQGMLPDSKLTAILDQSQADTIKPVDEIMVLSDTDKVRVPPPQSHPKSSTKSSSTDCASLSLLGSCLLFDCPS